MTKRSAGIHLHTEVKGLSSMPSKYPFTVSIVGQVQCNFFRRDTQLAHPVFRVPRWAVNDSSSHLKGV